MFCSNDNPVLILTYFTSRSIFAAWTFLWENMTLMDFFRNYCIMRPGFGLLISNRVLYDLCLYIQISGERLQEHWSLGCIIALHISDHATLLRGSLAWLLETVYQLFVHIFG